MDSNLQPGLWPEFDAEPFERRVTRVLGAALETMQDAIASVNRGSGIEVFESAVDEGVSSNLCSAVSKLIESGRGLDLSLTWAQSRRTPQPRAKFSFVDEDSRILSEAARLLKDKAPRPDEDLTGFVTKLSRPEGPNPGKITLKAVVDEQLTSVSATLDDEMYAKATAAQVIPPFLRGLGRRIYAAILSFWAGVIPPLPILGRSLL
ncbi:hypothetical protein ACUXV3_13275 [Roseobacteraceae bacterium NS-SX3]